MANPSAYLKQNIERILELWESRVLQEIQSSTSVTSPVLKNDLRGFLTQLANSLTSRKIQSALDLKQKKIESIHFARNHGSVRAATVAYTLADMISEMHILREVVFDVVEEEAPLSAEEKDIIFGAMEAAVMNAASEFASTQQDHLEKFAMTLMHDLRNPIAVAKLNAQMIKRTPQDVEHVVRAAEKIDEKMNRLEKMIRELLDVSRFRAGHGILLDSEIMRLDLLAGEVMVEMAETHGDVFDVEATQPVTGHWNREGLRRVIENLAINGLKYGRQGGRVRVTVSQRKDDSATLTVHNDGNPIPPVEQQELFRRYRRSANAISGTGWGLGLALVSAMVEAHRGTIRVESSDAQGTDFIVVLPTEPVLKP
ncbi:MAG TPA: HAMP domain-containing sensor histidine kinase [Planctomycetota bacterium]|nr:HAMP domain-containing sensor histidine kinase [Planctomycetota bacterium]